MNNKIEILKLLELKGISIDLITIDRKFKEAHYPLLFKLYRYKLMWWANYSYVGPEFNHWKVQNTTLPGFILKHYIPK